MHIIYIYHVSYIYNTAGGVHPIVQNFRIRPNGSFEETPGKLLTLKQNYCYPKRAAR